MRYSTTLLLTLLIGAAHAERINHEGRILPDSPVVITPLLFNTPEADAVLASLQILPRDNPWNEAITNRPLLSNSAAMITQITNDLASDRRTLRPFYEMNYVLVPGTQPTRPIEFLDYPDESDLDGGTSPFGQYPIPGNLPIEEWPLGTGTLTLDQWQQDVNNDGGDRHAIILKPSTGELWETWQAKREGTAWQASNGAKFSLNSNALRPDGWTSGDAAGLSMFAGLVRYDECARGMVEHAIRLVVKRSRRAYIYPATHFASTLTGANYPAMGQRLRLKSTFNVPSSWTIYEKAVAAALKKYGAIVADNGNFFSISVAPDTRFPSNAFNNLSSIGVGQFEVIQTTGPNEGPRSPGAPTINAGADQSYASHDLVTLNASATDPDTPASNLVIHWRQVDGPGTVTFGNAAALATSATFSVPGRYTLMVSVDDGVHTTAYDTVVIDTTIKIELIRAGTDVRVRFGTVYGQNYRVERSSSPGSTGWVTLASSVPGTGSPVEVNHSNAVSQGQQFYRVTAGP
jgi:hypothetical protein